MQPYCHIVSHSLCCLLILSWKEILGVGVGMLSRLIRVPATFAAEVGMMLVVIPAPGNCPSLGYHRCDETAQQKQVWKERVLLAYASISLPIIKGSQDRSSNGRKLEEQMQLAGFLSLLITPRTTSTGDGTSSAVDWTLLHPSPTKKMSYRLDYSPIQWRYFLN